MECPSLTSFPLNGNNEIHFRASAKTNSINTNEQNVLSEGKILENSLSSTLLKPVTKTIQKSSRNKRTYVNTSNKIRFELIEAVHKHGQKIKDAAQRLGINYSAAKAICQVYKREGRGEKKAVKIRKNKQGSLALKQDISISMDRAGIKLMKIEERNEFILEKLEPSTEGCKNESVSDQESYNVTDNISFPRVLYQNKNEDLNKTYQRLNLNGFATIPPCSFSNPQGANIIIKEDFLPINFQSVSHLIQNSGVSYNVSNIPPQHILISNAIPSLPPTSLNLPYTLNADHGYLLNMLGNQTLCLSQDQIEQNSPYMIANTSLSKQTGLLSSINHDFIFKRADQDQFRSSLSAQLPIISSIIPVFGNQLQNFAHFKN